MTTIAAPTTVRYREQILWWDRIKMPLFYAILFLWFLISIGPFWLSVVYSFMPKEHVFDPPRLFPIPFSLENYRTVLTSFELFPRWLFNSAAVSLTITLGDLIFAPMAGYAFARLQFPFKNALFIMMLVVLMLPGQVTWIPNYLLMNQLGILNTLFAVIFGGGVSRGMARVFSVFMMKQFYESIPTELEEAALMDGANRFQVFFRVIFPISQAALVTLVLFTFQSHWNEFPWPYLVLQTPENFTLPIGLLWFKSEYYTLYSLILAGSLFNTLPTLILFFLFQRYFIRSVALTGLKEG